MNGDDTQDNQIFWLIKDVFFSTIQNIFFYDKIYIYIFFDEKGTFMMIPSLQINRTR